MREFIKIYEQNVPALRFIGIKYGDSADGFGAMWREWFESGRFAEIERRIGGNARDTCEDGDAYIGLIGGSGTEDSPLEYWIGLFTPENTAVPEGFGCVDFPKGKFGICWLYGKDNELYGNYGQCVEKMIDGGFAFNKDLPWCFERYASPRFTTPDEKGNVILDVGFFII
jgi:hypothetical protein